MMKKKSSFLAVAAGLLILTAGIGKSLAYFTTFATAAGGYPISLGDRTEIREEFSDWTKRVVITSEEDSEPVYIRVKAFCGSEYELVFEDESGLWSPGEGGYYYYGEILPGGGSTEELRVQIRNIPQEVEDGESLNVIVVYESTPVRYRADGTPYADWNVLLDTGTMEGGGE